MGIHILFISVYMLKTLFRSAGLTAFSAVSGILGAGLMWSCTSETPSPELGGGNTFIYCDEEGSIESAVYTVEDKVYTFYFSPTKGLVTLDAILLADDYIKVVTGTPSGDIDLLSQGNSLQYKNIDISSETPDNVSRSSLSLTLTSTTTAVMDIDVSMTSGETLLAHFDGICVRDAEDEADGDIVLDKQIFFYYMGPAETGAGTSDYYMALTNLEGWTGSFAGNNFTPQGEGYILTLDFYGKAGEDWKDFPTGTFTESADRKEQTYYSAPNYSFVSYCAADGTVTDLKLNGGPVTVTYDNNGYYTVTAEFIDMDGNDRTITYTGELNISNGTVTSSLPLIGDDVVFDGVPTWSEDNPEGTKGGMANAVYSGDVYGVGAGLLEVTMYDIKGSNNEPYGYAMRVALFTETFSDDTREIVIPAGTYNISETLAQGTALIGTEVEVPIMSMIMPFGTYVTYDDQTQVGQYSFAQSGTVTVTHTGDKVYRFDFDIESTDGHTITGAFEGPISVTDESGDDGNDGSTNLTTNVEMNLGYLPGASCSPRTQIYAAGLGMIDVDDIDNTEMFNPVGEACGYQVIDIGAGTGYFEPDDDFPETGKLREGDIIRFDLLVEPGTEDHITPGVYTVTANRYPAQMKPGVCVRGYTGTAGTDGTRYSSIVNTIGNGFPYGLAENLKTYDDNGDPITSDNGGYFMINGPLNRATVDLFACIYEGTVTISKAEGGDNWYTFSVNGKDVLQHTISGSWTGPVWLNGDTSSPVLPSGTQNASASVRTAGRPAFLIADVYPYVDIRTVSFPVSRRSSR